MQPTRHAAHSTNMTKVADWDTESVSNRANRFTTRWRTEGPSTKGLKFAICQDEYYTTTAIYSPLVPHLSFFPSPLSLVFFFCGVFFCTCCLSLSSCALLFLCIFLYFPCSPCAAVLLKRCFRALICYLFLLGFPCGKLCTPTRGRFSCPIHNWSSCH